MPKGPAEPDSHDDAMTKARARAERFTRLIEANYDALRQLARTLFQGERANHSMSPTVLVHEAFVRLVDQPKVQADDWVFFRRCFARECRRLLVDHARARNAERRGGGMRRVSLSDHSGLGMTENLDLVDLNDKLQELYRLKPRTAEVVDMRLFAGMTLGECAAAMGLSERTMDTEWSLGFSWLRHQLS